MPSSDAILVLDAVSKRFESPVNGGAIDVLRDVSLSLGAGESVAIMGPSGAGKSTLLGIAGALDVPTSGSVRIDGAEISKLDAKALAGIRREKVGFVFQQSLLLPHCTALENVLLPLLAGSSGVSSDDEKRARELLAAVGLEARLGHKPAELSGGERQRVAIARALIQKPRVVLADEPTGSLDRKTAAEMAELLFHVNREQRTALLIVTHSMPLATRASRLLELDDGALRPRAA